MSAEFKHGFSGYQYWHCRCDICVGVNRKYSREWQANKMRTDPAYAERQRASHKATEVRVLAELGRDQSDARHGTTYGYAVGCRCDACRNANRVAAADLRNRRREEEGRELNERRPDPRHAVVKEMWLRGEKPSAIASATGFKQASLSRIGKRLGLPPRRKRRTQ